jgi:hypothetical protein
VVTDVITIEHIHAGQVEEIDKRDFIASHVLLFAQDFIVDLELGFKVGAVRLESHLVGLFALESMGVHVSPQYWTEDQAISITHFGFTTFSIKMPCIGGAKLEYSTEAACSKSALLFKPSGTSFGPRSEYFSSM